LIYSIRIGFLLAILSVIVGAGIYQGSHTPPRKIMMMQGRVSAQLMSSIINHVQNRHEHSIQVENTTLPLLKLNQNLTYSQNSIKLFIPNQPTLESLTHDIQIKNTTPLWLKPVQNLVDASVSLLPGELAIKNQMNNLKFTEFTELPVLPTQPTLSVLAKTNSPNVLSHIQVDTHAMTPASLIIAQSLTDMLVTMLPNNLALQSYNNFHRSIKLAVPSGVSTLSVSVEPKSSDIRKKTGFILLKSNKNFVHYASEPKELFVQADWASHVFYSPALMLAQFFVSQLQTQGTAQVSPSKIAPVLSFQVNKDGVIDAAFKLKEPSFETRNILWPSSKKIDRKKPGFILLKSNKNFIRYGSQQEQVQPVAQHTIVSPQLSLVEFFKSLFQSDEFGLSRQRSVQAVVKIKNNMTVDPKLKLHAPTFQLSNILLPVVEPLKVKTFVPPLPDVDIAGPAQPAQEIPIAVQSAALMGDVGHTQLVLRLTQKPFYTIRTDNSLQIITLIIDNINSDISSIPPLDTQGTAIQNIAFNVTSNNQFVVTLTLLPQMEVQGLRFLDNNLVLDVGLGPKIPYLPQNGTSVSAGDEKPLVKTFVPLSSDELATENYDEAVDLLNQGNATGAMGLLQMLVTQHPDYLGGRILLGNLLLQQNNAQKALNLLQGTVPQPDIQNNTSYYNLLAEAYRQTGDAKSAVRLYRQLLTVDSTKGAWWVGLGMCFETLNQTAAATEAYQKAQSSGNLSQALQDFVSNKLGSIK
jgi:predicted negative regulator of RcsB-dependent stress response